MVIFQSYVNLPEGNLLHNSCCFLVSSTPRNINLVASHVIPYSTNELVISQAKKGLVRMQAIEEVMDLEVVFNADVLPR